MGNSNSIPSVKEYCSPYFPIPIPSLLHSNLNSKEYKNPACCQSVTKKRGQNASIICPYARVVERLDPVEFRDDKLTYIFTLSGTKDLRTSLSRVFLEVDSKNVLKFKCTTTISSMRMQTACGDMRDLEMWNSILGNTNKGMYLLPIVGGYINPEVSYQFMITMASRESKPVIYVHTNVETPYTHMADNSSMGGMEMRPKFVRAEVSNNMNICIAEAKGDNFLAFVLVKTTTKLSHLSIVDSSIPRRTIISVPSAVARFDARLRTTSEDTYCVVLDTSSWTNKTFKDMIMVGGALDLDTQQGALYLILETSEGDCVKSDVNVMICEWFCV